MTQPIRPNAQAETHTFSAKVNHKLTQLFEIWLKANYEGWVIVHEPELYCAKKWSEQKGKNNQTLENFQKECDQQIRFFRLFAAWHRIS